MTKDPKEPIFKVYATAMAEPNSVGYEFVPIDGQSKAQIANILVGTVFACEDNGGTMMFQPEPGVPERMCLVVERRMAKVERLEREPEMTPPKVLQQDKRVSVALLTDFGVLNGTFLIPPNKKQSVKKR
jgi:hypothetical protein